MLILYVISSYVYVYQYIGFVAESVFRTVFIPHDELRIDLNDGLKENVWDKINAR